MTWASALIANNISVAVGDSDTMRAFPQYETIRGDLRRFRVPCAACGRGTVGVDETVERD